MNKETAQIVDYINNSGFYLDKLDKLRQKYKNIKDFQNIFGYLVMEIVNNEAKFINLSRKNIDLPQLAMRFF